MIKIKRTANCKIKKNKQSFKFVKQALSSIEAEIVNSKWGPTSLKIASLRHLCIDLI